MTAAPRAFVLGGGVAGIAAALGLRDRGHAVTLLEAHGWLGGRAFSFVDKASGRRLDNGPHAMLGCYRAMRALLRRLGSEGDFAAAPALAIAARTADGRAARLRLARLPVPLAMPFALRQLPWRWGEIAAAWRGFAALLLPPPAEWSVGEWARRRGQVGAPLDWLWQPLCRAIMNVEPDEASARSFAATLREAFGGSAANGAFWIPRRPWGESVGDAALRALAAAGVEVRCGARVTALQANGGALARLRLGDDSAIELAATDVVVAAMPWHALAALLPSPQPFAELGAAPLVSAHFAFAADGDAPPDEGPLTTLVAGAPFHFLYRTPGARRGECALLAGGCRDLDGRSVAAIEQLARAQLARHYPGVRADAVATVRISKEARATFVAAPGSERLRPAPGRLADGPRNLWVCGDWTATDLPATLEGAARSAERLLAALDRAR